MSWTRRSVAKLKVGGIISPEYTWCARILKIYPCYEQACHVWIICDPNWVADQYYSPAAIQNDIVGPHLFKLTQRPLYWDGRDDLREALDAPRFT